MPTIMQIKPCTFNARRRTFSAVPLKMYERALTKAKSENVSIVRANTSTKAPPDSCIPASAKHPPLFKLKSSKCSCASLRISILTEYPDASSEVKLQNLNLTDAFSPAATQLSETIPSFAQADAQIPDEADTKLEQRFCLNL